MKFISLFAGIGGFDLGLERAGMECVAQVEIDPFCLKVLEKHWPNVKRYTDVRECGKHNLPPADLICGGFPCQPHSIAGKRKGAKDDRDLWPEYRRIITECKPNWVFAENVSGIRTTILDQVLSDLDDLKYTTGTLNIPACAFDAPHRRERIFIIAHANNGAIWEQRNDEEKGNQSDGGNNNVADADSRRCEQRYQKQRGIPKFDAHSSNVSDPISERGCSGFTAWKCAKDVRESPRYSQFGHWDIEPPVGRVANGVPRRVDRLRSLGNAVVPQIVEWIGRQIMKVEATP